MHKDDLPAAPPEAHNHDDAYRQFFENAVEGFFRSTTDGRFLLLNPTMARIFGYASAEEMMRSVRDMAGQHFVDPGQREELRKIIEKTDRVVNFETRVYRKDRQIIWVSSNVRCIHDGGGKILFYEGVVTDVTERKEMESALKGSAEEYRMLVENALDAIVIVQDGMLKFANRVAVDVLGYPRDEIASRPFNEFIHPDDRRLVYERYLKRLMRENAPSMYEFRIVNKEGRELNAQINSIPVTWRDKPAALCFVRDISAQKALEKRLLQAQKMEAIGTLAGGIAHDFNNLLMGIQGYASLMLQELEEGHPVRERVKGIESQVKNGADLARQLLGFARGGRFQVSLTDINDIIQKTSSMFGRTRKEIAIHAHLQDGLWSANVDQNQIEQVLLNLYVNASQAMPGGGSLYLHSYNIVFEGEEARSLGLPAGRYIRIGVTDTGMGMDDKTKARIFEPFFTTKEMGRGTGLGLATVYGIVTGHGGAIQVYSEKGQGTTFHIFFPASEVQATRETERIMKEETRKGNETILIVDDEEVVATVAGEMLEHLGYQVIVTRSGKEALEVFSDRQDEIDLILLDMIMPKMSGGETFDQLKVVDPGVRVILSSGYSIDGEARQIISRGCKGFINKPYTLQALSEKIREALS
ncbi:MAG: hybrid sensor histidine kinase/response regulator [Deltaproteobacteria bacterium HGW-Deltaproteobacteria-19]|jgi:PAS domain S-box-containing protein|nr:MAG: hybrid sensor histidine kinase/response regulator [Deltaproteobacteria bacterium HGW-Deltaproteobacteria-19]